MWLWRDHRKLHLICLPFIYRALHVLASLMHFSLKESKLDTQPSPSSARRNCDPEGKSGSFYHFSFSPSAVFKWFPLLWMMDMSSSAALIHDGKEIQAHFWFRSSKTPVTVLARIQVTSNSIWAQIISSTVVPWCSTLPHWGRPWVDPWKCFTAMRDVSANSEVNYLPRAMYGTLWRGIWNPMKAGDLESWMALKCWSEETPWTSCWWWHCLLLGTLRPRGTVGIWHGDTSQRAEAEPCWHGPCYSKAAAESFSSTCRWSRIEFI